MSYEPGTKAICRDVKAHAAVKIADVEEKIADLKRIRGRVLNS